MAGYISLFFEDSRLPIPNEQLSQSKEQIYTNYKNIFRNPNNTQEKNDLRDFIENQILQGINSSLQQGNTQGEALKEDPIKYWDISIGTAIGVVKSASNLLDQISNVINYISFVQNTLSDAISKSRGLISQSLIDQMNQNKQSLVNIAARFNSDMTEDSFKGAFWGALIGAIAAAQGSIHEAASAIAAVQAKQKIEKELVNTNNQIKIIVEATGGKLDADSALMQSFKDSNIEIGRANNAKNDLTIAAVDGNGKIIWNTGISLKSTSSRNPTLVKIMEQSLTTLLNKVYTEEQYLNVAAGLGLRDWAGTRKGIGALAKENKISLESSSLTEAWKTMIYNAIYVELINMFAGTGTALNNVQYLIVNAQPHAMYEIFEKLESIKLSAKNDFSIPGIEISGASNAAKRLIYLQKNIDAFVKADEENRVDARIQRSTSVWTDVYSSLSSQKIKISLKYAQLFAGATR